MPEVAHAPGPSSRLVVDVVVEGCTRKIVYPDDLLNFSSDWDQLLRDIIPLAVTLPQPLRKYLDETMWAELTGINVGHARVKSISECYFQG